jgi:hypothetical protein
VHKGLQHRYEAGIWTTKGAQSQLFEKSILQSDHKMGSKPDSVSTNGKRSQLFENPIFQREKDTGTKRGFGLPRECQANFVKSQYYKVITRWLRSQTLFLRMANEVNFLKTQYFKGKKTQVRSGALVYQGSAKPTL